LATERWSDIRQRSRRWRNGLQWLTPKSGKSPNSRHFWEDGDRVCRACRWLRTLQIVKVGVF
jgi:hypothetical protein